LSNAINACTEATPRNVKRRQLTTGQRAFAALRYEEHYAAANPPGRPRKDEKIPADLPEFSHRERESRERAAKAIGCRRPRRRP
jgi:hypothetical protein